MSAHPIPRRLLRWKLPFRFSFQVFLQNIKQLLGRLGLLGVWLASGINHMKADVPVEDFVDKSVHRASTSDQEVKDRGAVRFVLKRAFNGVDLSSQSAKSIQQFFLISRDVGHGGIILYPPWYRKKPFAQPCLFDRKATFCAATIANEHKITVTFVKTRCAVLRVMVML